MVLQMFPAVAHPQPSAFRHLEEPITQGYPTVGLYLWSYGSPKGGAVSYERGTPVTEVYLQPQGSCLTHKRDVFSA